MATVEEKIPPLEAGQRLSRAEFLRRWEAMPELKHAELLGGVVHMPSPTSWTHGRLTQDTGTWLGLYRIRTPGCDGGSDNTWLMEGEDTPQPDNGLWVSREYGGQSTLEGNLCAGAPELIVEVSLARAAYDRREKRVIYRASGVREYIIVLPNDNDILWLRLVDGQYDRLLPDADGIFRSLAFPGLWLDGAALLALDCPRWLAVLERGLATEEHQRFVAELQQRRTHSNGN